MAMEQFGTRLPKDRADELREYCEEKDISQSRAIRRLVEQGLDREQASTEPLISIGAGRDGADTQFSINRTAAFLGSNLVAVLVLFLFSAELTSLLGIPTTALNVIMLSGLLAAMYFLTAFGLTRKAATKSNEA